MKTPEELRVEEENRTDNPGLIKINHAMEEPLRTNFNELDIPMWVMCAPNYMQSTVKNNIWIEEEKNPTVDMKKACKEFYSLYNTMTHFGAVVYLMPPQPGLQDLTFTANLGTVIPAHIRKNTFVPSTFRSTPRIMEQHMGRNYFSMMGYDVINSPYFNEGYADIKWVKDNIFIAGYGIRTDIRFHRWFEEQFNCKVISVQMNNPYLYHFDCNFFQLSPNDVMISINNINYKGLKEIEKHFNVWDVSEGDSLGGSCNSIKVGNTVINHTFIHSFKKGTDEYNDEKNRVDNFLNNCSELGLELVLIDIMESTKMGALVSCCGLPLTYGVSASYSDDGKCEVNE